MVKEYNSFWDKIVFSHLKFIMEIKRLTMFARYNSDIIILDYQKKKKKKNLSSHIRADNSYH